ncbi:MULTISPECIES: hypothetical protein [unclassified Mesobacillus]|uniref:hypothetical protein n=1 Tax=unclassified Mesobacillus TaxID=2675270 RepID=UPI00203E3F0B|nr:MULTISPECIES: hypothetical protein [unclassified Mesobacillus]MCM3121947.1 hypothetical protein [Mesobacillus sp. MER 33]MCM3231911.1 hypothetical protein [Mesobacillus sp. MER 48]
MPLFVNGFVSPQVFSKNQEVENPENQEKFRLNYLNEVLNEQQKLNHALSGSVMKFDNSLEQNRQEQIKHFNALVSSLAKQENLSEKVIENIYEQKESTSDLDDKLIKLEEMHEQFSKTLLNKELTSQAILDQLACQQSMIIDLNRKLLEYEDVTKALVIQAQKQEELQDMIAKHIDLQGIFHETVMEQLGKQDAVGEGISDQLGEIKSSLSTKANEIIEKLENQYSKFTHFLLSLIVPNITQKKIIRGKMFKKENNQEK